jgi:hypothetical protein
MIVNDRQRLVALAYSESTSRIEAQFTRFSGGAIGGQLQSLTATLQPSYAPPRFIRVFGIEWR